MILADHQGMINDAIIKPAVAATKTRNSQILNLPMFNLTINCPRNLLFTQ
jgi:hypothetical protein